MAKLFITPLGSSCRKKFCDELQNMEYGVGAIVLPNRLLLDEVRKNYANVETVGMDTLASKLLNLNGYVTFNQINRHSQELIIEDFLHTLAEEAAGPLADGPLAAEEIGAESETEPC